MGHANKGRHSIRIKTLTLILGLLLIGLLLWALAKPLAA